MQHKPGRAAEWSGGAWRYTRGVRTLAWLIVALGLLGGAEARAQTVEYYHLDALGSVRAVTAQNGAVIRRHDFAPFGEEVRDSQGRVPLGDKKLFTGQEHDSETALDYFGARYYRANVGRFTTVDPGHVGGDLHDPQSWNAYAYARNNPLKYVDPEGLAYRVQLKGYDPVWFLNDQDFEWMLAHPELNPGISFDNGIITAGGQTVGSYQHFDDSDAKIGLAGDLAAFGLRREGKEMAAWAASGAIGGVVTGTLSTPVHKFGNVFCHAAGRSAAGAPSSFRRSVLRSSRVNRHSNGVAIDS
jgi:RHS repeat-associated protein